MAGQRSMVKPTNKIVLDSQNMHIQTCKIETATTMYAGRLVKTGTNDDDIVVNTAAGAATGWLGYEQTTKKHRPATVDTIYLANAQAAVLNGSGMVIVGSLALGQNVTKGARLVAAAAGELTAATAITATVPSGATAVTSSSAQPAMTMAGGLPTQGIIVAIAEESMDASAAAKDILVRSLI